MADTRTDNEKTQDCARILQYFMTKRLYYETMVDNIFTFVNHSRRKIVDKDQIEGQKTGQEVYDGTPLSALNLLVDGMVGYLCSRNLRWFAYTLPGKFNFPRTSLLRHWTGRRMDEYPDVKRWLQDSEEVIYSAFNRSNFYDVVTEFVSDAATAGTAYLDIEEDLKRDRIVFTVPHYRECWIAENRFGFVDTVYRVRKYTMRQIVEKFENIERKELLGFFNKNEEQYANNPHDEVEIFHAVYPRKDYDHGAIDAKNKPIASLWITLGSAIGYMGFGQAAKLIDESGYDWLPIITWRWRKNSDEWYGRSPSWDAFVTIMTGQEQAHSNLIAGQKMAEPPMIAPLDMRGKINLGPKGWTFVDQGMMTEGNIPRMLDTVKNLPYAVDQQERTQNLIKEFYHVNLFLMLYEAAARGTEMTATQAAGMMNERAAILGTRIGRLQSEGFIPIHNRVFDIKYQAGRIPEPPPILFESAGGKIEIDFLGPLAQAQKRQEISRGLQAGAQFMTELAQANPQMGQAAWDNVDIDEMVAEGLDSFGFPAKCLRNEEDKKQIREMRQKQMQEQRTIENMPKIAKAAALAGKATEEGSPLSNLFGGGAKEEGTPSA